MDVWQIPLTAKAAASVGERLKLLVLLHSLVGDNEAQVEVLHILLPAVIAAASANMVEETQVLKISASLIFPMHLAFHMNMHHYITFINGVGIITIQFRANECGSQLFSIR